MSTASVKRTVMWLLVPISLIVLVAFLLIVVSQTAQVVELADRISPLFGTIVLWVIIGVFTLLVLVPVIVLGRLPRTLTLPDDADGPEYEQYLHRLAERLSKSELASNGQIIKVNELEQAIARVDARCNEIIRETAATVFLVTAVSQSGRFDAVTVLSAQSKMVLAIARAYFQRPSVRQILHLYANVAGTALVASEIDDIDIEEQIQPIIDASLGGIFGMIPGVSTVAALATNMILTGSANAFFTLRVGVIARRYCAPIIREDRRAVRRAAATEALKMLRPVLSEGTAKIGEGIRDRVKGRFARSKNSPRSVVERRNAELDKRRWWHSLRWSKK